MKKSEDRLSPDLARFQAQIHAQHAFQCVVDLPYEDMDPFEARGPLVVPARTLLSHLL